MEKEKKCDRCDTTIKMVAFDIGNLTLCITCARKAQEDYQKITN